jgi:(E)-4-hydroxy-3-methylbut-2-enyl-diphosphate synthase
LAGAGFVRDPYRAVRRRTREVAIGDVVVGGSQPLRVQSMTTTDTRDTRATCDQVEALVEAGCEIVRVTAPSITDAENLAEIQHELARRKRRVPLVADIHFTPNAALEAARHVEKVRINPGNYADKKRFAVREYTDAEYRAELERVAERFRPLVRRLRELSRALRIGTNHGSLSDRIMNRYGDTPLGMVESALEFLDVCEDEDYRDVVFSMKASNPQVAIHAYRLLAARLAERDAGPSYPFHLGVTEAGDGEDARIKSAIGIGALLEDGIGDTIRVSLTEDPVREIPVARALARRYEARFGEAAADPVSDPGARFSDDAYAHARRRTRSISVAGIRLGAEEHVRAELEIDPGRSQAHGTVRRVAGGLALCGDLVCEGLLADARDPAELERAFELSRDLEAAGVRAPLCLRVPVHLAGAAASGAARLVVPIEAKTPEDDLDTVALAAVSSRVPLEWSLGARRSELACLVDRVAAAAQRAGLDDWLVSVRHVRPVHAVRVVAARLRHLGLEVPIVLRHTRDPEQGDESALLAAATDLGAALCDGIGDAVCLSGFGPPDRALPLVYRILQGARLRTSWAEFISCPSCGRTLFDLEETTARIKARTGHLSGVKIAIMGCIVNGPGEMADADFGYVGSGPGRVSLYVGKECVVRAVPEQEADERLVALIQEHGSWTDPDPA